jgi:hypothetical protein
MKGMIPMRISKKILACVLAALMAIAMMPFTALASELPTATVTDITAQTEYDIAYQFAANNDGADYNNYKADFIVTVDRAVNTADVQLFGKIGDQSWVQFPEMDAVANYDYYMARDAFQWEPTYEDICNTVGTFSCAVKGSADVATNMTVKLVIYPAGDPDNYTVINEFTYEIPGDAELPTATVTDITASTSYDKAYQFTANNDGVAFNDYKADYIVTVDKDVNTADVQLFGKIADGAWTQFPEMEAKAGTAYYLARDAFEWEPTYEDICNQVGTFGCAIKGEAETETNMNVKLVIYKDGEAPIVINEFNYVIPGKAALPTATIEAISVEDLETAYKFTADTTDTNSAYAAYKADFTVSFDQAVDAGAVVLKGQYGDLAWTEFPAIPALAANEEYRLLANANLGEVTYDEIVKIVKEFNCGAIGVDAEGVTMTVKFNIYDANDNAYEIVSKSYTFASDKMSITVEDKVDLNVYVAENVPIQNLRITYNATPELEENNQTSEIVDYETLPQGTTPDEKKVNIELAPAQIMDNIKIEALDDQGEVIKTIETSVADYCKAVLNMDAADLGSNGAAVQQLAKATLDYGKAASDYFHYNTTGFAGYANQLGDFTDTYQMFDNATNLSISSVTYRATSVPELRFVVNGLTEAQAAALNDSIFVEGIDGVEASFAKREDGRIILQVTNIPIAKFDQQFTVYAGGYYLSYTPLKWVEAAKSNAKLAALANAVGNQFAASKDVF